MELFAFQSPCLDVLHGSTVPVRRVDVRPESITSGKMSTHRPMHALARVCGHVAAGCALVIASAAFSQQSPTFRAGADLIAVDVQVLDSKGFPVAGLAPEDFEVRLNGRSRRVASAQFIRSAGGANNAAAPGAPS